MQGFLFIISPAVSEDAAGLLCHSADNDILERTYCCAGWPVERRVHTV